MITKHKFKLSVCIAALSGSIFSAPRSGPLNLMQYVFSATHPLGKFG